MWGSPKKKKLPAFPWKWSWAIPVVRFQNPFLSDSGEDKSQKAGSPTTSIA